MIRRLLVADRGWAARRICATCRLIGIETVAVYSDADAAAPHVGDADWAVHLPGNAPTATYLRGDLILRAARKTRADAIHPGWGALAADPDFATAVTRAGLTWVGPPPEVLALLRDPHRVGQRLAAAGVPTLPRVACGPNGAARASGHNTAADGVGAPDWDGHDEPGLSGARRLEVPVVADGHGHSVAFSERDCSVQRRHHPLVMESPSPGVPAAARARLQEVSVRAATALGLVGASTVRLLLSAGDSYVVGLSPRLSGEHAITEGVAGVDLVRLQLLLAEGGSLPFSDPPPARGHAVGVRLRAEDPADAWRPTTGTLHRFAIDGVAGSFRPQRSPGVRLDAAVTDQTAVTPHYDSSLASLVVWAPTRPEAVRTLAASLTRSQIHGVVTNRDLLVRVLRNPTFLAGDADTGFLDEHPEAFAPLLSSVDAVRLSCLAAALAAAAQRRNRAAVWATLPSGWRNVPSGAQTAVFEGPTGAVEIGYRLDRGGDLAHWWVRAVDPDDLDTTGLGQPQSLPDDHPPVAIVSARADRVVLDVAGVRLGLAVHRVAERSYVDSPEGSVVLTELPRHPLPAAVDSSLVAPVTGQVAGVHVVPGQRVSAGDLLLTLEGMAQQHQLHAPAHGIVTELAVRPGARVEGGAVLGALAPD
jgi:propionyl-CoA carboxylase alpha chain